MGLFDRLRRRPVGPVVLAPADPLLMVLVEAFEAARADSCVLRDAAERGVDLSAPLLLRHHLVGLPDDAAVARAAELLGQDGYALAPHPGHPHPGHQHAPIAVVATRTQVLTALSASQERSRMAGLAQRLGGDVAGWDALGHPASE